MGSYKGPKKIRIKYKLGAEEVVPPVKCLSLEPKDLSSNPRAQVTMCVSGDQPHLHHETDSKVLPHSRGWGKEKGGLL